MSAPHVSAASALPRASSEPRGAAYWAPGVLAKAAIACGLAALSACTPPSEVPLDVALAARDDARALDLLDHPPGLARWLRRVGDHAVSLRGVRFDLAEEPAVLGAALVAEPGRWDDDHWPLGHLRLDREGPRPLLGAPAAVAGRVQVTAHVLPDAVDRIVGGLQITPETGANVVLLRLDAPVEDFAVSGAELLATTGSVWAIEAREPFTVTYARSSPSGHDALVLVLPRWLPGPLDHGSDVDLDVRVEGVGDRIPRSAVPVAVTPSGWHVRGSSADHGLIVGARGWDRHREAHPATVVDVAVPAGRGPLARALGHGAASALRGLQQWGELPRAIHLTAVHCPDPPQVHGRHLLLSAESLQRRPAVLAHELAHVLWGPHGHGPPGIPTLEEPVAEWLAAQVVSPREAHRQRLGWALAAERDGRSLLDAYRSREAQYAHGPRLLDALAARLGHRELAALLRPLGQRAVGAWHPLIDAVAEKDPEAGAWLREAVEHPGRVPGVRYDG